MNIDSIQNGVVIDHIQAGQGMKLYHLLKLDETELSVAIIRNVASRKMGKKDIPETLTDVLYCKNPRCITSTEQELKHIFRLSDREKKIYRCLYCETKAGG